MPMTTRAAAVVGLSLAGLVGLMSQSSQGQTQGDQPAQGTNATQPAPAAPPIAPAVIGSIDMERVIQEYEKYKEVSDKFQAEAMNKQKQLASLLEEAKQADEKREQFKFGTPDYQKWSDQVADIQARYNAQREKIAMEFQTRESNAVAEIFNDIRQMVEHIAKHRKMTFVVQVSKNEPIVGDDPNTVMAAMARNVVYHDPSSDITNEVIRYLNHYHNQRKESAGAAAPAPAANAPAPTTAAPRGN